MVLSEKLRQDLLLIVDDLKVNEAKTKLIKPLLDKLFLSKGSGLIALPEVKQKVILAARNIPKVSVAQAKDLNVLDILSYKYLLMPKKSIEVIEETFGKKEKISKKEEVKSKRTVKNEKSGDGKKKVKKSI